MDLQTQQSIADAVREYGAENVVVVLGTPSPEAATVAAETVVRGDPTFAGPLSETQLGLPVYHILEDEVRCCIKPAVYEEQVGLMADALDRDELVQAVAQVRAASPA
jgi:glycine reductase